MLTKEQVEVDNRRYDVLSLDDLIAVKRHLTRPKDLQVAIELEAIREKLEKQP